MQELYKFFELIIKNITICYFFNTFVLFATFFKKKYRKKRMEKLGF